MSGIATEIIVLLLLILVNGILSMSEIAVVSARKARLQQRADDGDEKARSALELANEPSDFLSTIQIGITLVGILAGAFGGATIANEIAEGLAKFDLLAPYSEALGVLLVVLVITYFTLVLGELAPKKIGLNNPEDIASRIARPMYRLSRIALPLVRLLSYSTDVTLRIIGVKPSDEPPVTEDEIKVMIDQGTEAGVFEEEEQDMVEAIFRLGDRRVENLITPRTELVWLDIEDPIEEIQEMMITSAHTRFPVARGRLDNFLGIVYSKHVLSRCIEGEPFDIESSIVEPLVVPENIPALNLLEMFQERQEDTAIVIDEYGGLQGLVTLYDILEAIVGELPDSGKMFTEAIKLRPDGSWLVDGMLPVDEFKEAFNIKSLPDDDRGSFHTMGGFVITYLGRIPSITDNFNSAGYTFEVVDMDGLRVDKLLITQIKNHSSI